MRAIRIKELFKFFWLLIFAAGALAGCAVFDDLNTKEKPFTPPVVQKKPAPKELGSLWSEDSMWNHVYTSSTARVTGDIISIRLDEAFKNRLMRMRDGSESEPAKTEKAERNLASSSDVLGSDDKINVSNMLVRGSIDEVGQRGVYKVTAGDTLRLGGWEPYVVIKGRVRDRDIDNNDEVRVADIVDLSFEIMNSPYSERKAENVSW